LKANTIGKLRGLVSYKRHYSLWWIITQIQKRGKSTRHFEGPNSFLEKLDFKTTDTKNWRVLYKVAVSEENSTKIIEEKIKKFMSGATFQSSIIHDR
jgi:hypothetical protein